MSTYLGLTATPGRRYAGFSAKALWTYTYLDDVRCDIAFEDRTYVVKFEDRTCIIVYEDRTFALLGTGE